MRVGKWTHSEYGGRIETCDSPHELIETLKSRSDTVSYSDYGRYISLQRDADDRKWSGFSTCEELENNLLYGMPADEKHPISAVSRTLAEVTTEDVRKLVRPVLDVQGGVPVVPLVLKGIPPCMRTLRKEDVPSKIITVVMNIGDTCEISADRMREVNIGILSSIFALEKAGYRVRIYVQADFFYPSHYNMCRSYALLVKSEHQVFNLSRILYPLTETSYFRGITFDWHTSDPEGNARYGLGCNAYYGNDTREAMWASLRYKGSMHFLATRDFTRTKKSTDAIRRECLATMLKT